MPDFKRALTINGVALFDAAAPTTTRGDLIARGASANARLAIGAGGRYLRSDGADPSWAQLNMDDVAAGTLSVVRGGSGVNARPAFQAYKTANQTIAKTTFTKITWANTEQNIGSYFDTTASWFKPLVAGTYLFAFGVTWTAAVQADKTLLISLYKSGSEVKRVGIICPTEAVFPLFSGVFQVALNGSSDYVELYAYHSGTVDYALYGAAANTWWTGIWAGPAS